MGVKEERYNFKEIEQKWQKYWQENRTFAAKDCDSSRPKYYVLDMFPYPSAEGLHVGHPEGYTASDIVARYKRRTVGIILSRCLYGGLNQPIPQQVLNDRSIQPDLGNG